MRISDWSSDVCSSDLVGAALGERQFADPEFCKSVLEIRTPHGLGLPADRRCRAVARHPEAFLENPMLALLTYFFAGAFLVNGVPHFVQGVSGRGFPSPFANPPGRGESSAQTKIGRASCRERVCQYV